MLVCVSHLLPAVLFEAVQEAAGVGQPEGDRLKVIPTFLKENRTTVTHCSGLQPGPAELLSNKPKVWTDSHHITTTKSDNILHPKLYKIGMESGETWWPRVTFPPTILLSCFPPTFLSLHNLVQKGIETHTILYRHIGDNSHFTTARPHPSLTGRLG